MTATPSGAPPSLAVVILTLNEEVNLPECLRSLGGIPADVYVVDSGSTDRTAEIARAAGAQVLVHPFETFTRQWAWAMSSLPVAGRWVLALDADQRLTPELRGSLAPFARGSVGPGGPVGYFINRRLMFLGGWIRFGGVYPKWFMRLFQPAALRLDTSELVDHHFYVEGPTARLPGDLIEDNAKDRVLAHWISKCARYARVQAEDEFARQGRPSERGRLWGNPDERLRWRKRMWERLPLYVRPILYFLHRFVVRGGFLDGRPGVAFHFLQALWYRMLVDIHLAELRSRRRRGDPGPLLRVDPPGERGGHQHGRQGRDGDGADDLEGRLVENAQ